jgi:CHAT domain-containing protein
VRRKLRAIVIGDPGDPREGASLEFARREALEVTQLLRDRGVEVTAFIGAPSVPREGALQNVPPAKMLAVLNELMKGDFDILHYAGHGDFDAKRPETTGWVFQGGLLTSRHLELVDIAPSLVFANACLSAVTAAPPRADGAAAGAGAGATQGTEGRAPRVDADLLPGLADEFFRRGVRNYVGTAWRVNDEGAVRFAREFYTALLTRTTGDGEPQPTIGSALLRARCALHADEQFGTLWAAYQHYGDPQHTLIAPGAGPW